MSDDHRFRENAMLSRAIDGSLVVVLRIDEPLGAGDAQPLVEDARAFNARAIWVFGGTAELGPGFTPTGGYVRFEAQAPPPPLLLPSPPRHGIRELQTTCFAGVWGPYETVSPDPVCSYVGLRERGRWVGICQVHLVARWIDGPGVHPMLRSPERSAQLVRGAAAYLPRNRPVTLETWGDSPETLEAYQRLGFEVVEEIPGWELRL
jgi:hypothetical protein